MNKPDLSTYRILPGLTGPADLHALAREDLDVLAAEVRDYILAIVSRYGGHLSPNLGTVELTIALLRAIDAREDRVVWDVGHQAYPWKILTDRRDLFPTIRQHGGISGFLKRTESAFDHFGAGHASTSVSAALGMALARDFTGKCRRVFAVIGDGGLTGGMAFEALNNAGASGHDITIILNDNKMAIAENVGALSRYLNRLMVDPRYNRLRHEVWDGLGHLDRLTTGLADNARGALRKVQDAVKCLVLPGTLFEELGLRYFGPVNGHDLDELLQMLDRLREIPGPKLLHVITIKGKGYDPAEKDSVKWHGLGAFDKETGEVAPVQPGPPAWSQVFGETLTELAEKRPEIVAITGAMPSGTGVHIMARRFPDRVFDVGIAEQHAVTFAAGLACDGIRPVVAIYSTFLQRAYDQIVHDVALQHLPVVFCLDRAGLVGADGPTHHGALDIAYLRSIQGMVVMAPSNEHELRLMMHWALDYREGPVAIRYPRGSAPKAPDGDVPPLRTGAPAMLHGSGEGDLLLASCGHVRPTMEDACKRLEAQGISCTLVDARFCKPLDRASWEPLLRAHRAVVSLEDGVRMGGFGSALGEFMADQGILRPLASLGLPDTFVNHGDNARLLKALGLDAAGVEARALQALKGVA